MEILFTQVVGPCIWNKYLERKYPVFPTGRTPFWWGDLKKPQSLMESLSAYPGGGGGCTPDFKWQGWSKDFLGCKIFDSRIFFLGGGRVFKTIGRFVVVPAHPSRIVLWMKYNKTCFSVVLMHLFHKTVYTIVCKVSYGDYPPRLHSIDFSSIVFIDWLYHHWNSLLL